MYTDKITIAIPVYERFDYFESALNSALNQTVKCRVIVVDNDSSHTKFEKIVSGKSNVQYFRNSSNIGMTGNWNRCIELCETEYITILHDDDMLHPQFIEVILKCYENSPNTTISVLTREFSQWKQVEHPVSLLEWKPSRFLLGSPSGAPGYVFPVSIAQRLNGFNAAHYPIADFDFWYRLTLETKLFCIEKPLAYYRQNAEQGSSSVHVEVVEKTKQYYKSVVIPHISGRYNRFLASIIAKLSTYNLRRHYESVYCKRKNGLVVRYSNKLRLFLYTKLAN